MSTTQEGKTALPGTGWQEITAWKITKGSPDLAQPGHVIWLGTQMLTTLGFLHVFSCSYETLPSPLTIVRA